jgi:uncharacterized protein YjbJ (UPF0337 family)
MRTSARRAGAKTNAGNSKSRWIRTGSRAIGSRSRARSRSSGGKLTDDDLATIDGKREQLKGALQKRYGIAKDEARQNIDDWLDSLSE